MLIFNFPAGLPSLICSPSHVYITVYKKRRDNTYISAESKRAQGNHRQPRNKKDSVQIHHNKITKRTFPFVRAGQTIKLSNDKTDVKNYMMHITTQMFIPDLSNIIL